MYRADSLSQRIRYSSPVRSAYRPSAHSNLLRCNLAIIAILTIATTAFTAYVINAIANSLVRPIASSYANDTSEAASYEGPRALKKVPIYMSNGAKSEDIISEKSRSLRLHKEVAGKDDTSLRKPELHRSLMENEMHMMEDASEGFETRVKPSFAAAGDKMKLFQERLANLSDKGIAKLLEKLDSKIEKAGAENSIRPEEKLEAAASKQNERSDSKSPAATGTEMKTVVSQEDKQQPVVIRSDKMRQLMNYLEQIESIVPEIDANKLEKLFALDDKRSTVRILKPQMLDALLLENLHQDHQTLDGSRSVETSIRSWRADELASVAPDSGWQQQQQQQPLEEDWPAEPSPAPKPRKKKKRKRISTTSSTTSTTTTAAPVWIETSTFVPPPSAAPPTSFEEVWIEEEEDIVRPPRRKLKKYKKKTQPESTTSTTTTSTTTTSTTTSTTTTPPPTSTTAEPLEDWPNDPWPQSSTTKIPHWWPQPQEEEKWPEYEWLDAVKDNVQSKIQIVYV